MHMKKRGEPNVPFRGFHDDDGACLLYLHFALSILLDKNLQAAAASRESNTFIGSSPPKRMVAKRNKEPGALQQQL